MKRLFESLFLLFVLATLTYSSGIWFLGVVGLFALLKYSHNHYKKKVPVYLKSIAYSAIVPFAFWWVLSPSVEHGFSPWLVIIPSWYFMFLALWQWRGLHRGGFPVFVYWNGLFVLLLSLRTFDKIQLALMIIASLFLFLMVKTPRRYFSFVLSLILSSALGIGLFLGAKQIYDWRQKARLSSGYHESFAKRNLMGFSPVARLGSFESNYVGERNSEIVFRIFTSKKPEYLRGIVYGNYFRGLWKKADSKEWVLPERYIGDYAVFGSGDSLTDVAWVQSAINSHGYFFAPLGAGVAVQAADSIEKYAGGTFYNEELFHKDWYYIENEKEILGDTLTEQFLQFSPRLDSLLKEITLEIGLADTLPIVEFSNKLKKFFFEKFEYTLTVPLVQNKEPLEVFWKNKKGYCEYFATLATLVFRYNGIPARYVVGFSAPIQAPSQDYYLFLRRNSHAWVEYFNGSQWVTFDPTPGGEGILLENMELSYWQETMKVKMLRFMHFLKNGEWRRSLDSWTVVIENVLRNVYLWLVLAISVVSYLAYRYFKRKKVKSKIQSARILKLQKMLIKTERQLLRIGFSRKPGETVSQFLKRLNSLTPKEKLLPRYNVAKANLQEYEKERWRKD